MEQTAGRRGRLRFRGRTFAQAVNASPPDVSLPERTTPARPAYHLTSAPSVAFREVRHDGRIRGHDDTSIPLTPAEGVGVRRRGARGAVRARGDPAALSVHNARAGVSRE